MEPDPIVNNPPSRRLNNRRHHQWNLMNTHFQIHNDGRAADDIRRPGMHNGRVKLDQELHLRTLHRDLKQLRNLHSCLHCHDQAPVVEQ